MNQTNAEQPLLEILKRRGVISSSIIKMILAFMERWQVDAYRAITETHTVEEQRLADILADEFKLTRIQRLRSRPVDKVAIEFVSYTDAMAHDIMPYAIDAEGHLQVAVADPTRTACINKLQQTYGKPLVLHVCERLEIEASIQRHYPLSLQLPLTMEQCFIDSP
jgi:hypothetical protein